MAIKPILFNAEMVRAILDGRKTVTRRVVKLPHCGFWEHEPPRGAIPPYQVGDVLWARETWGEGYEDGTYIYKADDKLAGNPMFESSTKMIYHPSIYMPKAAARIWLRVTDVRVERLQDITPEQCVTEGIGFEKEWLDVMGEHWDIPFAAIWDSNMRGKDLDRYGWAANPWVWVIEFERCEKPEGV